MADGITRHTDTGDSVDVNLSCFYSQDQVEYMYKFSSVILSVTSHINWTLLHVA